MQQRMDHMVTMMNGLMTNAAAGPQVPNVPGWPPNLGLPLPSSATPPPSLPPTAALQPPTSIPAAQQQQLLPSATQVPPATAIAPTSATQSTPLMQQPPAPSSQQPPIPPSSAQPHAQLQVGAQSSAPSATNSLQQQTYSNLGIPTAYPTIGSNPAFQTIGTNAALPTIGSNPAFQTIGTNAALPTIGSNSANPTINAALPTIGSVIGANSAISLLTAPTQAVATPVMSPQYTPAFGQQFMQPTSTQAFPATDVRQQTED